MPADLRIVGGVVIDPASGYRGPGDLVITDGRIAAMGAEPEDEPADGSVATEVIDATGLFVVPGLIDLHTHVYPGVGDLSIEADLTCLGRGVTTVVDAGSAGANTFPGFRRHVIDATVGRVLAWLNISAMGLIDATLGELHDLRFADAERAAAVAEANRDVVVGFKVRMADRAAGPNGVAVLDRALAAGRATGLPVMVHGGPGAALAMRDVVGRLRAGDVLTHTYSAWPPSVAGALPTVVEARRRGVRLDTGHGAGGFSWAVAERALEAGLTPDTISTDLHRLNVAGPVHDLATTMSKFLLLGMPLASVIACATATPAAVIGRSDLGSLSVGSIADVTLLRLDRGSHPLVDTAGIERVAAERLVPAGVIRAGQSYPILPLTTERPVGVAGG